MSQQSSTARIGSPWATGPILFSGGMLVISGVLQIFVGVTALIHDSIYAEAPRYAFAFDLTAWGWIQLITAIAAIGAGYGALRGLTWARMVGIFVAGISMVAEFAYIPYFPAWAVLVIGIDIAIIWGLASYDPGAV